MVWSIVLRSHMHGVPDYQVEFQADSADAALEAATQYCAGTPWTPDRETLKRKTWGRRYSPSKPKPLNFL